MINLKYLKTTTNNDKDTIFALLDMFKLQIPELKSGIITAFEEKNWLALREAAHKAKNSFQILGMQDEAEELQKLEILCSQEKEIHLYEYYVKKFVEACDSSVNEIERGIDLS
ncbi:MAG: Hpt domain-containing protein [Bacteroidota bacterium]